MNDKPSIPPSACAGRETTAAGLRRLRADESGAIMVIAVFMSACLVGCIWYMYGLGEAMVYRQQMRAAADATAFHAAVMHAVGMNVVAMINVAMAVVLSILLFLQIIFVLLIVLTVIAALILLIPGVDLLDAAVMPPLIDADETMFNVIQRTQEPIFWILTGLNVTSGVEAVLMPWVAHFSAAGEPDHYAPAAERGDFWQPFSWSMIPNRIPFFSNELESWLGYKLGNSKFGWAAKFGQKLPILTKIQGLKDLTGLSINPAKLLTSRYGLPVQDDKYPVLCQHAAQELFDEFSSLVGLVTWPFHGGAYQYGPDLSGLSYWFGIFIGSFPGIFCSGVDPMLAIQNQLGIPLASKSSSGVLGALKPLSGFGWFKAFQKLASSAKDATSMPVDPKTGELQKGMKGWNRWSMYPMKPYDLFQNGNGFGQVWAIINGKDSLTTGAQTGVDVASWGTSKLFADSNGDSVDFSEAEFYYDCGPHAGPEAPGRDDTDGVWGECKYNAMWNMKWKARLRRYHPFEFNAEKAGELALYNGLGAESMLTKFIKFLPIGDPFGVFGKYSLVDAFKSCSTSVGQGKSGWTNGPEWGACPIPMGGPKGGGNVTVGWNSDAPGVGDYSKVYH